MNRPIRNLAVAALVLFLALLINASWLQYWKADDLSTLSTHPDNRRVLDAAYSRPRGAIVVGGAPIAVSNPVDDQYKYQREYPQGRQYAHLTGFFTRDYGIGGVEASQNAVLSGEDSKLFINRVIDLFGSEESQGGSVSLTINRAAQQAAFDGLRNLGDRVQGAVVAIEPNTGRILALVSSPSFNPNRLASHDFKSVADFRKRLGEDPLIPLNNRAIETILPPGSTFKLVTAAAALSDGYTPETMVFGGPVLDLPGTTASIRNAGRGSCGGDEITFIRALQVSCNTAFGDIGMKLGGEALRDQARKFGFGSRWFHDLDDALTSQSISRFPADLNQPQTAQSAIGQFDVAATPLQMAVVAAGIANGGEVMRPYLVDEIRSANLEVLDKTEPESLSQAISPSVASDLTDMMVAVVDSGTASNARISGVAVAGKTGTAQSAPNRPPYAWFTSFAPADNARVAVAVLVQDAGVDRNLISGGGLAAPIAKAVMEAVINP